MGGTDRMDQNINHSRIAIRGKKWYWPLFTWLVDAAIHNAWRLHHGAGGRLTYVEFRRSFACCILQKGERAKHVIYRRLAAPGTDVLRFDGMGHLILKSTGRGVCRNSFCSSKVSTKCKKCDIYLYVNCFADYHTKGII